MVGTIDTLFQHTRRHLVDEIFFTRRRDRDTIKHVLEQAREHGVDLRVVPEIYDEIADSGELYD
ncbi:MAG: hypothetical protein M3O31_12525 [Acidobacteriota bacterium]|nr:hypothetical protein [Acidobacteriota bacterium]